LFAILSVAKIEKKTMRKTANKEILVSITKAIGSSMQLRSKKELIESFVSSVSADTNVEQGWREYVQKQKAEDLQELIKTEHLRPEETEKFIESSFKEGQVRTTGTDIDKILPPMSRFGGGDRQEKKKTVIEKIQAFFERYFGL
jgi:type I restriction enzyme, R subunit